MHRVFPVQHTQLAAAASGAGAQPRLPTKPTIKDTDVFEWLASECGAAAGPHTLHVGPVGPAAIHRGVTCQEHVSAGTVLLQIPLQSTLVARSPLLEDEDKYRRQWLSVDLPKLAMRLLRVCHCGLMPCIQPWTHVLPKVSPMLIHRTAADQLRHLCSPWLAEEALSYLAAQQEGLEAHADELASLGLHRQDFEWAYGIAHSRAGGWNDTQARYDIIIPGVDLVNHDRSPTAQIRPCPDYGTEALAQALDIRSRDDDDDTGAAVSLVAKRNIEPGEEITIFYGNFTASEYLLDYGFVPAETEFTLGQDFHRAHEVLRQLEPLCT